MMFFKSSLETLIPLPNNNKKFNACPASQTIHWLMPLEARSFTGTYLSFIPPLRDTKTLPSNEIKMENKSSDRDSTVFSSLLNVMQWAVSPPLSHFLQSCSGLWPGFPTPYTTLLHMTATSCFSYTFYTPAFL